MGEAKRFYNRYWKDEHIKVSPFDNHPGEWTNEAFVYHLNFFKPFVKGRLLDFGCGEGQFLHMISKYCESTYGVDVAQLPIEKAHNRYPDIEFSLLNDEGRTRFQDNFFDAITAITVLEHILDIETTLDEINRILKPGGYLLIATTQITRIKMLLVMMYSLDKYFYPTSSHIRHFTRRNLADILQKKGFKVIKYKKYLTFLGFIPLGQMVIASKID